MLSFLKNQVESTRPDGYWLEAFPFHVEDTCAPNLVGHGLGTSTELSKIEMFINPRRDGNESVHHSYTVHHPLSSLQVDLCRPPRLAEDRYRRTLVPCCVQVSSLSSVMNCHVLTMDPAAVSHADITGNKFNDRARASTVMVMYY